jgi:hypothetical protein
MPDQFNVPPFGANFFTVLGGIGEATTTVLFNDSFHNGMLDFLAMIHIH